MTAGQLRMVYLLVGFNVAVHIGDMPFWIPGCGLLFVLWRWLCDVSNVPKPKRWGTVVLGLLATAAIYAQFGKLIGDPASSAILVVMIALKTLELKSYRDLMAVTYLSLFLLMAKLLNSQSLAMTAFLLVDVTAVLALMYVYHQPFSERGLPWRRALRLVAFAAPIFIGLFILFPRFNFGFLQRTSDRGPKVGFSGQIRPGEVSRLAQSDQIAFRAFFKSGSHPPVSRLYWRGAVLENGKDLNWDPATYKWVPVTRLPSDEVVEVMIDEGGTPWIFTLDWPQTVVFPSTGRQFELRESSGLSFSVSTPLQSRETYAFSYDTEIPKSSYREREAASGLETEPPSESLQKLLSQWREATGNADKAIELIRKYYEENGFRYTLNPPRIRSTEDFLFNVRRGFCEHYAATTTTLLRHLQIPARIVVGYQGGSPSLMGDYWIVYQRDAHAWIEYWDPKRDRWTRLDPTAWVAADRVALGGQSYFEQTGGDLARGAGIGILTSILGPRATRWVLHGRLAFDQVEVLWTNFLLRYDFRYQQNLLQWFGFKEIGRGILFTVVVGLLIGFGFLANLLLRLFDRGSRDLAGQVYQELRRRLARAGLAYSPQFGPLTIADLALHRWPHLQEDLSLLFTRVIAAKYGNQPLSEDDAILLRKRIRALQFNSARHD